VVGDDEIGRTGWQVFKPNRPQAEKHASERPVDAIQQSAGETLSRGGPCEPGRLILRQHRRAGRLHRGVRCCRLRFHKPQQIAHLRHAGEILLGDLDAENALQLEAEAQPFH
jgi:hypothetical protein